jgi:ketosteroid isomerase-like protein
MSREVADNFIQALGKLEEDQDADPIVSTYTEDCEVGNVAVPKTFEGHEGAREFWTNYRKTFGEMRSTFRNVFASEDRVALEWTTEGTSNGDTVTYEGVSILEIDGDKVSRFHAYFDPRALSRQVID